MKHEFKTGDVVRWSRGDGTWCDEFPIRTGDLAVVTGSWSNMFEVRHMLSGLTTQWGWLEHYYERGWSKVDAV